MKRRLTIARSLDQRARGAAARRAHHRARPAGAPRAVGPPLPAEAAGRHPRAHHPLHGRGRAAVRPPRRHGQGAHRRRGLAARAHRALLDARGASSCASRRATAGRRCCDRLDGLGDRVEVLPDRVLLYTDDGDATVADVHRRGSIPENIVVRRVDPGGRVPAAHRPHAWSTDGEPIRRAAPRSDRRRSSRVVEYWMHRRTGATWRGIGHVAHGVRSTRSLFLLAMGVGLGSIVDKAPDASVARRASTTSTFLAPGLLAATAMQVAAGESTYPVLGVDQVEPHVPRDAGDAAAGRRPGAGQLAWIGVRLLQTCDRLPRGDGAVRRDRVAARAVLAIPGRDADRPGVRRADRARSRVDSSATPGSPRCCRFGIMPMFLFSGTFFPITQLPTGLQRIAYLTPLWHGVDLCRTLCLGTAVARRVARARALPVGAGSSSAAWLALTAFDGSG